MEVTRLLLCVASVAIVTTTPCPFDIKGCRCEGDNKINCYGDYEGKDVPDIKVSNVLYKQVNIRKTNIKRIRSKVLTNVMMIKMDLGNNNIEVIHQKAFWTSETDNKTSHVHLAYLDLGSNKLVYIRDGTFDPLTNLRHLYLFSNRLRSIGPKLIVNLVNLKKFHVANNNLTALPSDWLPGNLTKLNIAENKLRHLAAKNFVGSKKLTELRMSPDNIIIEFETFSYSSSLTSIVVWPLLKCNCRYVWYLNTVSNDEVCQYIEYKHSRMYLSNECIPKADGYYA